MKKPMVGKKMSVSWLLQALAEMMVLCEIWGRAASWGYGVPVGGTP